MESSRYLPETMRKGRAPREYIPEMRLMDDLVKAAYRAQSMGMDTGDWLRYQANAWRYVQSKGLTESTSPATLDEEDKTKWCCDPGNDSRPRKGCDCECCKGLWPYEGG